MADQSLQETFLTELDIKLREEARKFAWDHYGKHSESQFLIIFNAIITGYALALKDQKEEGQKHLARFTSTPSR